MVGLQCVLHSSREQLKLPSTAFLGMRTLMLSPDIYLGAYFRFLTTEKLKIQWTAQLMDIGHSEGIYCKLHRISG